MTTTTHADNDLEAEIRVDLDDIQESLERIEGYGRPRTDVVLELLGDHDLVRTAFDVLLDSETLDPHDRIRRTALVGLLEEVLDGDALHPLVLVDDAADVAGGWLSVVERGDQRAIVVLGPEFLDNVIRTNETPQHIDRRDDRLAELVAHLELEDVEDLVVVVSPAADLAGGWIHGAAVAAGAQVLTVGPGYLEACDVAVRLRALSTDLRARPIADADDCVWSVAEAAATLAVGDAAAIDDAAIALHTVRSYARTSKERETLDAGVKALAARREALTNGTQR